MPLLSGAANVLRTNAQADDVRRQALHAGNVHGHLQLPWRLCRTWIAEDGLQSFMRVDLEN